MSAVVAVQLLVLALRCRQLRRPNSTLKGNVSSVRRKDILPRIVPTDNRGGKAQLAIAISREKCPLTVDSRVDR
jgi:hypothetical protein